MSCTDFDALNPATAATCAAQHCLLADFCAQGNAAKGHQTTDHPLSGQVASISKCQQEV